MAAIDLHGLDVDDLEAEMARRRVDDWPDDALVAAVSQVLAVPRRDGIDSFVLHAPLELCARTLLLPVVDDAHRRAARRRLVELAARFEAWGDPVTPPTPPPDPSLDAVLGALGGGDLDLVDAQVCAVLAECTPDEVRRSLVGEIVASTAAAAHAPILGHLHGRAAGGAVGFTSLVWRQPVRALAMNPDWWLTWFDWDDRPEGDRPEALEPVEANATVTRRLFEVKFIGPAPATSIHPTMMFAETQGVPAAVLAGIDPADLDPVGVEVALARLATASMLSEPDTHAPYGWSHCLTMPQGVMRAAADLDVERAIAVAVTHAAAFRATLGTTDVIDTDDVTVLVDPPLTDDLDAAVALGSRPAASVVAHADDDRLDALTTQVVSLAATHSDAHLVKHTLACLDAIDLDPTRRRQHLAAAAHLLGWWGARASQ